MKTSSSPPTNRINLSPPLSQKSRTRTQSEVMLPLSFPNMSTLLVLRILKTSFINVISQIIYSVLRSTHRKMFISNCVEGKISECLFDTAHKTPGAQEVETLKIQLSTYTSFFTTEIQEDARECLMLPIEISDKRFGLCPTNDNINNKG